MERKKKETVKCPGMSPRRVHRRVRWQWVLTSDTLQRSEGTFWKPPVPSQGSPSSLCSSSSVCSALWANMLCVCVIDKDVTFSSLKKYRILSSSSVSRAPVSGDLCADHSKTLERRVLQSETESQQASQMGGQRESRSSCHSDPQEPHARRHGVPSLPSDGLPVLQGHGINLCV